MHIQGHKVYTFILLILLLLTSVTAYSQENQTKFCIYFRTNSASIDSTFYNNAERLSEISSSLQKIGQDSTRKIVSISLRGSSSPDGSYQWNQKLSRERLKALEDIVRSNVEIPDSIITRDESYISWDILKEQVIASDLAQKQAVLDIIAQEPTIVKYWGKKHIDYRIIRLRAIDGGRTWRQLNALCFERMRNASVIEIIYRTYEREILPATESVTLPTRFEPLGASDMASIAKIEAPTPRAVADEWSRKLYIKTNALGWGLAIANIGVEVDIAKHWSFAIPLYCSTYNYFTSNIKFRTLNIQPEVRYWFKKDNQRFFVGAHFGYAQYNIATNGDYRYQDHNGTSPALGGGISVGYRMPISKNNRWHIEFALGAGVYGLHYDKFYNVNNGKFVGSYHKTYWGIDNAAVNISYRFDLNKRKR